MRPWPLLLVALARIASADSDDDDDTIHAKSDAKAADASGREHYRNHEYEAAIRDYRHAHDVLPDPLFLFDMAQAHRHLHRCAEARDLYREYLAARPDADNRPRVEGFIEEMAACAPHPVEPVPPPPPPPTASSSSPVLYAGIATAGLGVVLLGAGVYFSVHASDAASDLEAACAHGCSGAGVASIDQSGRNASHNAALTYAFGGAAIAAGTAMVLYATLHTNDVAITPTASGATISARFQF